MTVHGPPRSLLPRWPNIHRGQRWDPLELEPVLDKFHTIAPTTSGTLCDALLGKPGFVTICVRYVTTPQTRPVKSFDDDITDATAHGDLPSLTGLALASGSLGHV